MPGIFEKERKFHLFYNCSMPALFAFANRARQWYNTYNWVKWRLLRGQDKNMWKDRIRPGNPEKLGVTRAGRELNFAVAVQDGKTAVCYCTGKVWTSRNWNWVSQMI